MSLFEDTNPRELKELLAQIHGCEAALPDFQRDFVWDPGMTQELIVSIANNYPAGSLLRIRNTHNLFACREFAGAPALNGKKVTYLVLDGQQRLTSLYQAFYGVGEHRYFIDLKALSEGKDFEESMFHLRTTEKQVKKYETLDGQRRDLVMPLSILRRGPGEFYRWTKAISKAGIAPDSDLEDKLLAAGEKWVQTLDDYRFPVVTLSDETHADAVCTIFETLNRTGVKLSVYELLTARFWPHEINLRKQWSEALRSYPIVEEYEVDPYYVLQGVALVARPAPSCKRSDVLSLTTANMKTWWQPTVEGFDKALEILREDCGVVSSAWLPYSTIVAPMAAVLARTSDDAKKVTAGAIRQKLVRWFWCSVFGQTYENAPNSRSAKDLTELSAWIGGGHEPEAVAKFKFDPASLRETTPRQRAVYRGIISLVLTHEARDFHKVGKITSALIVEKKIEDHHIFPQKHLGESVSKHLRDCVLNRTLIDRDANGRILDRAPSDYMGEMRKTLGPVKFKELLDSHVLPSGDDSPFWKDDFEGFLTWRQDALWRRIQTVTGSAGAAGGNEHKLEAFD